MSVPTTTPTPQPYAERMAQACAELRELLDPQTEQESRIVDWLTNWELSTITAINTMVDRVIARAEVHQ